MTPEILIQIGIFTAVLIVVAGVIAIGLVAVGSDFQREFEQEQSDERSERRRY
ncbi:hypothetical protein [Ralstonia mannitolilytica]|uniref:hypothetical protein n=1 Tax=Ralstonia mannitolilytica TaxID=105219 RepID=UPI0014258733|nr:hypothetical protein [Ralstonia mannitolilytica]